jgi:predicted transcriptional regulator
MKIFVHPSIDDIKLTNLLYALGDKSRLQIVQNLYRSKNPLTCTEAIEGIRNLPISTRSHCFDVLRQSGVIRSEKKGRECYSEIRLKELNKKFPKLLANIIEQKN